jgi:hypothetical protein
MKEKLKEFISFSAVIIPMVYIVGFVIINSYLSRFGVLDSEFLSITYLKAGVYFSFLCFMVFTLILISFARPTDNLKKNAPEHVLFFHNLLFFCSVVSLFTFGSPKTLPFESRTSFLSIGFYCFMSYMFLRFLIWKPRMTKITFAILYLIFLSGLLLVFLFALSNVFPAVKYFVGSFFLIGFFIALEYGDYKDGTYRLDKLGFAMLLFIMATSLYGRNVYCDLPTYLGGSKNPFIEICLNDSISIENIKNDKIFNKEIIYSNSTAYYIQINDSTLVQVNKDIVKYIKYKTKKH